MITGHNLILFYKMRIEKIIKKERKIFGFEKVDLYEKEKLNIGALFFLFKLLFSTVGFSL